MSTILVIEDSEGQRAEVRADLQLKRVRAQRDLLEQNEELKRLARTDALTGLANRRKLDERLLAEFRRSARFGTPFAIAMADIDRFKSVNDEYGHLVGGVIISGGAGRG
ncbi:MAG: diguanylate cyclase, partial [bacterium]|nr:diguanylate cyclase [bacterium]